MSKTTEANITEPTKELSAEELEKKLRKAFEIIGKGKKEIQKEKEVFFKKFGLDIDILKKAYESAFRIKNQEKLFLELEPTTNEIITMYRVINNKTFMPIMASV